MSKHGQQCEIEKVALEGEGLILDRVEALWKLLLNWLPNIKKADLIMFACHSQGVPVAIMLMGKLIELGCLKPLGIVILHDKSFGILTNNMKSSSFYMRYGCCKPRPYTNLDLSPSCIRRSSYRTSPTMPPHLHRLQNPRCLSSHLRLSSRPNILLR